MSKDETPFSYVLGKDIEALPKPLRQFLSRTDECRYVGTYAVTRGSSRFSKFIGMIIGLPRAGIDMPFELITRMADDRMVWRRSFNGKALTTRASITGKRGLKKLLEKAGAATLFMRMAVESNQLVFRSTGARFLGLPLPDFIAPQVEAFGFVEGANLIIESTTTLGRRRRLLRYQIQFDQTPVGETTADRAATTTADVSDDEGVVARQAAQQGPSPKQSSGQSQGQSQVVPRPAPAGIATKPMRRENMRTPVNAATPDPGDTAPDDTATADIKPSSATGEEAPPEELVSRRRPAEAGAATVPLRHSRKRNLPKTNPKD